MAKTSLIELERVEKVYGRGDASAYALRGVDIRIEAGEFVAIMGPSGSGKSTAMNIIGCLDIPSSGIYRFEGVDAGGLDRNQRALLRRNYLGFIFQGFNLMGRTSAVENVELPLLYRGIKASKRREMAMQALADVGLTAVAHHTPAELSGGQQQRVAIARAIVTEPLVILADEPTGNLDSVKSIEIMELLASFNKRGITVLMVTHEEEMAAYASRRIHFKDGLIEGERNAL